MGQLFSGYVRPKRLYYDRDLEVAGDLLRSIAALLSLALIVGGTLYGVLGVWGMSRGSSNAWILALVGAAAAAGGGALLLHALRRQNEPKE